MAIGDVFAPLAGMFGDTVATIASKYWWILFVFVGLAIGVAGFFLWKMLRDKKNQWTHRLNIRRVLAGGLLSKVQVIKMRRFPLIKRAEVFELEKPLLGGYLLPELDQYTDVNEYSIILDNNNRIYNNKGEYFAPDKSSVNVSAKHAEIDISRTDLRADYQDINKTTKRVEWAQIAKYAMFSLLIIAIMIVGIVALGEWGESSLANAKAEEAKAGAMKNLAQAMETSEATVNTQLLILDKVNQLYENENIQTIIRRAKENV